MRTIFIVLVLVFLGAVLWINISDRDDASLLTQTNDMQLTSTAFAHNGSIPEAYTCEGENRIPPLSWSGIPEGTKSLALIMDDPDIPESVKQSRGIDVFDHWVVFNMPATTTAVTEGQEPAGTPGNNGRGATGYTGPCPPDREHRYFFRLYALDDELALAPGATKAQVIAAMQGKIIDTAELIGLYNKKENR